MYKHFSFQVIFYFSIFFFFNRIKLWPFSKGSVAPKRAGVLTLDTCTPWMSNWPSGCKRNGRITSGSRGTEQLTYFLKEVFIKRLNFLYNIIIFWNLWGLIKICLQTNSLKTYKCLSQKYLLEWTIFKKETPLNSWLATKESCYSAVLSIWPTFPLLAFPDESLKENGGKQCIL